MKADVQYNDFVGTAAADISDHVSLNDFLETRGVDIERYIAIGAEFYSGEGGFFSASIICKDNQTEVGENPIVKIQFESEFTSNEFFNLFKRFDVVIFQKHGNYQDEEIRESFFFDDRRNDE